MSRCGFKGPAYQRGFVTALIGLVASAITAATQARQQKTQQRLAELEIGLQEKAQAAAERAAAAEREFRTKELDAAQASTRAASEAQARTEEKLTGYIPHVLGVLLLVLLMPLFLKRWR